MMADILPPDDPPDDPPQDEKPTASERDNILDLITVKKRREKRKPPPPQHQDGEDERPQLDPPGALNYFSPLGYDRDRFYFFTSGGKQIRELTAAKIGKKTELLTLAPLDWWEREFSSDAGFSGHGVEMAANYLIQACYRKGVFSDDRRRGRGVWIDGPRGGETRIVIHAGDCLYIDGGRRSLINADTVGVYEQQEALQVSIDDPLSVGECSSVLAFTTSLNWESPTYGYLLAGWLVVSIVSGALEWRPHTFLTGPKGCGKSWILDACVRMLGGFCLSATGSTTAAGLRQSLASDALPVLFDEAEGDSGRAADNIANVLSLMRHSSANLDAKVIKGGADGNASSTIIRSCFLLSAIRDPLDQAADKSRVTTLALRASTPASTERWKTQILPLANALCAPTYTARFRARVLANIPTLLASIAVFSTAAADLFGEQRMGDQIGAMLGGLWLITNDGIPTPEQARQGIMSLAWGDQQDLLSESSDEKACLLAILEAHIRVDGDRWRGDASIGELVNFVISGASADSPGGIMVSEAKRALGMYGLRVDGKNLLVSNTNGMLARKVMANTPWPMGWGKLLARLPGAGKHPVSVKIGGHVSRATLVPINIDDPIGNNSS